MARSHSCSSIRVRREPCADETSIDEAEKSRGPSVPLRILELARWAKHCDGYETLDRYQEVSSEVLLALNDERFTRVASARS